MEAVRNYDAHLDAKNRITLRGVSYQNYNVRVFENGCIIMEPRVLSVPDTISARTLADMDNIEKFAQVTGGNLGQVTGGTVEQNGLKSDIPGWEGQWFCFDTPGASGVN